MKYFLCLIAALVAALVGFVPAYAQTTNPDASQLQKIAQGCQRQQVNLRSLQKRDTVLRINRGRLYDMSQRQTGAFIARLQANTVTDSTLVQLDSSFRETFLQFKDDYDQYAEYLEQAIGMDCAAKPGEFFNTLLQATEARKKVGADVAKLRDQTNQYITELVKLRDAKYPQ